jgi:Tfp pilus assembly protein FimT
MENQMDTLQRNIASTRGEAIAASLLAEIAIRALISLASNKKEMLAGMYAFIDNTLNESGPGKGDANDEFSTLVRETARFQTMQHLDAIARLVDQPPRKD